jgi:hypothetical protein
MISISVAHPHAGLKAVAAMRTAKGSDQGADGHRKAPCGIDYAADDRPNDLAAALVVRSVRNVRDAHVIAIAFDGKNARHEDILYGTWFAYPHCAGLVLRPHGLLPRLALATLKFVALLRRYARVASGDKTEFLHVGVYQFVQSGAAS